MQVKATLRRPNKNVGNPTVIGLRFHSGFEVPDLLSFGGVIRSIKQDTGNKRKPRGQVYGIAPFLSSIPSGVTDVLLDISNPLDGSVALVTVPTQDWVFDASPVVYAEPPIPKGPTDIPRWVNTRTEQTWFRGMALAVWQGKAALRGYGDVPLELLQASHPKPRKDMSEVERLARGRAALLLPPQYHLAFDKHYIGFDPETGKIIFASTKNPGPGILKSATLRFVNPELKAYLVEHNQKVTG